MNDLYVMSTGDSSGDERVELGTVYWRCSVCRLCEHTFDVFAGCR